MVLIRFNVIIKRYFFLIFILIFFALIYFTNIDLKNVWEAVSTIEIWQVFVLIGGFFSVSGLYILNRKFLLRALGFQSRSRNLALIHFCSMAAHYSTPVKIGFPMAVYLLKRSENIPYASGTTLILLELSFSTGLCGLISIIGAIQYFSHTATRLFVAVLFCVSLIILFILLARIIIHKGNAESRWINFLRDIVRACRALSLIDISKYVLLVFLAQVTGGIILVVLVWFLQSDLPIWQAIVANSISYFLGAVSLIPMGLGVSDASLLFFLVHFGVPKEIGITGITIQRMLFLGLSYLLGMVAGSYLGLKDMKLEDPRNTQSDQGDTIEP